ERKTRRPHELLLVLRVGEGEVYGFRRFEFVLRDETAGDQLEDIQATRDLGTHDDSVVPVSGPGAGQEQFVRVQRTAVEKRDLLRMGYIGPVEHRDSALIKRLHHHVAARYRDQRSVVRNAVFLVRLRRGNFVVAVEDQILVLDA